MKNNQLQLEIYENVRIEKKKEVYFNNFNNLIKKR